MTPRRLCMKGGMPMERRLLAVGSAGAAMLEAFVMQCMAGIPGFGSARMMLMGAPREDAERLEALVSRYSKAHAGAGQGGPFACDLSLTLWPSHRNARPIQEQAAQEADRLLCRALFTQEQAELDPERAIEGSGSVAAVTWASCLQDEHDPDLISLADDLKDGAACLVMAGLCDPSGVSGLDQLTAWLSAHMDTKPGAVLLLPVHRDDDAALYRGALETGRWRDRVGSTAMCGMPEDCRRSRGGVSLAHWCAALAAVRLLTGREGRFVWRIPAGNLSWAAFGDMEQDVRNGFTRLLKLGMMLGSTYGAYLTHALSQPNWIRDKMTGWYHTHFAAVPRLP